jgi:N-acetylglutamate synthase-like GNAT family acetyltransferase
MLIRDYRQGDVFSIVRLFYETIHTINSRDYSAAQLHAWAPEVPRAETWHSRMVQRCTLVAEENGAVIAFAELEPDGHLEMFYCRKDVVGQGVGRQLYQAIELKALELGLRYLFVEASITARHFFKRGGFAIQSQQTVLRGGVKLTNFKMEKPLFTA